MFRYRWLTHNQKSFRTFSTWLCAGYMRFFHLDQFHKVYRKTVLVPSCAPPNVLSCPTHSKTLHHIDYNIFLSILVGVCVVNICWLKAIFEVDFELHLLHWTFLTPFLDTFSIHHMLFHHIIISEHLTALKIFQDYLVLSVEVLFPSYLLPHCCNHNLYI